MKIARSFRIPHPICRESLYCLELGSKLYDEAAPLTRDGKGEGVCDGAAAVKIGVLRDRAFNFYYPENLEALIREGAELLYIDSFRDRLPEVDGLYIGGGFPEFFLKELEGNDGLRRDIAHAVEKGLPVYAECAGLMYLCRSISWQEKSYEMVGIIPSSSPVIKETRGPWLCGG